MSRFGVGFCARKSAFVKIGEAKMRARLVSRYSMLDTRFWILDTGYSMLDT